MFCIYDYMYAMGVHGWYSKRPEEVTWIPWNRGYRLLYATL